MRYMSHVMLASIDFQEQRIAHVACRFQMRSEQTPCSFRQIADLLFADSYIASTIAKCVDVVVNQDPSTKEHECARAALRMVQVLFGFREFPREAIRYGRFKSFSGSVLVHRGEADPLLGTKTHLVLTRAPLLSILHDLPQLLCGDAPGGGIFGHQLLHLLRVELAHPDVPPLRMRCQCSKDECEEGAAWSAS